MTNLPIPYSPISDYYKNLFGGKAYKIPVSIADTCPNRMGLKGMKTCIFCDEWGSAAKSFTSDQSLAEQIIPTRDHLIKKYKAQYFLVYFQAYTSSFLRFDRIQSLMTEATSFENVKGCVVGTRPDCLSRALLQFWKEFSEKNFLSVELGVQSFNNKTLKFYERGHTAEDSMAAIKKIHQEVPRADLGIHLIFGAPEESLDDIKLAAEIVNTLPINHVKLHHLHVLAGTGLETLYKKGEFMPIEFDAYCEKVALFLSYLSPSIYVDRLAAFSPRWEELVAPSWTSNKMKVHQGIIDFMHSQSVRQGSLFKKSFSQMENLAQRIGS